MSTPQYTYRSPHKPTRHLNTNLTIPNNTYRPNTSPIAQHKPKLQNIQLTPDNILHHLNIELSEATQRAHTSHGRRVSSRPTTSSKQRSDAIKRSWLHATAVSDYTFGRTIGEGTFGKVKRGIHKLTNVAVAIKILEKDRISDLSDIERVKREICILCRLSHINCIQLYQIIDSPKHIFLIMEYCDNGELFDYIVQQGRIDEYHACILFHHIINGIQHCHTHEIIHRDLKPENLLLCNNYNTIKIVDFGLSNTCENNKLLKTACGSPCYAAPEMIKGQRYIGRCVDVWSCGVILYALLCGYLPFEDSNTTKLYDKIIKGQYSIPDHVSREGKDLIQRILNTDPQKRYTIQEIRQHSWYAQCSVETDNDASKTLHNNIQYDTDVLQYMCSMKYDKQNVINSVQHSKYNHDSATYQLLCLHKKQNNNTLFVQQSQVIEPLVHHTAEILTIDNTAQSVPTTQRQHSTQSHISQHSQSSRRPSITLTTIDAPSVAKQSTYTIPIPPIKLANITQTTNNTHRRSIDHTTRVEYTSPYIQPINQPTRPVSHRMQSPRKSITHTVQNNNNNSAQQQHTYTIAQPTQRIQTAYKRPTTSIRYQPLHLNIHNIVPPVEQPITVSVPIRPPTSKKPPVPRQHRRHSAKPGDRRHSKNTVVLNDISNTQYNTDKENVSYNTHRVYTIHTGNKPNAITYNDIITSYKYSTNSIKHKPITGYNNLYTLSYTQR